MNQCSSEKHNDPDDNNEAQVSVGRPFLISFSGIDGAGKTTQIEYLSKYLQELGLRVVRLSFWDNIAVWSKMRAGVGERTAEFCHADLIGEDAFVPKNNKHIRKWYLTAARSCLYVLDVVRLRRVLSHQDRKNADVVIFDRYIYDQIANFHSHSFAARIYSRLLLKQAPVPDLAFILDTSPAAAFARKPEYPLEFMRENRQSFLGLRELVPKLIIISGAEAEDVRTDIQSHIRRSRIEEIAAHGEKVGITVKNVIRPQSSRRVQNEPTASV
jgi:thymidylate kinase